MSEIDERTLGAAIAAPRYANDTSTYTPDFKEHGFYVGRNVTGNAITNRIWPGALNVFLAGNIDADGEKKIVSFSDHSEVHPGTMCYLGHHELGRSYYIKGSFFNLVQLAWQFGYGTLMVPGDAPGWTKATHGRIIVPYGVSADILPMLEYEFATIVHFDFNGIHYSFTSSKEKVEIKLAEIRARFDTSANRVVGMNAQRYDSINIESYPVEIWP